jgi:hypothetical protein
MNFPNPWGKGARAFSLDGDIEKFIVYIYSIPPEKENPDEHLGG